MKLCRVHSQHWNAAHSQSFVTEDNRNTDHYHKLYHLLLLGSVTSQQHCNNVCAEGCTTSKCKATDTMAEFILSSQKFMIILSTATFSLALAFACRRVYVLLYLSLKLVKSRPKNVEANPANNGHKQSGDYKDPVISASSQLQKQRDMSILLIQSAAAAGCTVSSTAHLSNLLCCICVLCRQKSSCAQAKPNCGATLGILHALQLVQSWAQDVEGDPAKSRG